MEIVLIVPFLIWFCRIGYNNSLNLPFKLNISRHVRILDLSKNHLEILDENTFGDCEGLRELNLYKNHIGYIKSLNCTGIKKLDLSWNHLHNLTNESFKNLSKLEVSFLKWFFNHWFKLYMLILSNLLSL